jgi:hypothetical protein
LGFVLFALPSVGDTYWKTFLAPAMVLGFGMAVTVAPLTTVVMTSVDQGRVGTASGINNAIARVAGVLAIAVFGMVMVNAFGSHLHQSLKGLSLPGRVLQELQANETRLAGMQVPAGVAPGMAIAIKKTIAGAFVYAFRIVMLLCAGLCMASAAVSWRTIPTARSSPSAAP